MSDTVDLAFELGCREVSTFAVDETDVTVGFTGPVVKATDRPVQLQMESDFGDGEKHRLGCFMTAKTARRIARALLDAADQTDV